MFEHPFDTTVEMAYQMECCGDLPTRRGKVNRLIREAIEAAEAGAEEINLDVDDLTREEIDYILKELGNRL